MTDDNKTESWQDKMDSRGDLLGELRTPKDRARLALEGGSSREGLDADARILAEILEGRRDLLAELRTPKDRARMALEGKTTPDDITR